MPPPDTAGKEVARPVVIVHQGPTLTQERYEDAVRLLTGGRSRLEKPADWPVDGLLAHTAGQGRTGFRVVDVWESGEAFQRFGEQLGPVLQDVGVVDPPEVYPATRSSQRDPVARPPWSAATLAGPRRSERR